MTLAPKMAVLAPLLCLAVAFAASAKVDHPSAAFVSSVVSKRSAEDLLGTPEWLQDIPKESKVAKYRKRRQVSFPADSKLNVEIIATIPTVGISDTGKFIVETDLTFNLPTNGTILTGRSFGPGGQRMDVYERFEKFLSNMGYDGHSCTLRTICEVAEMPFQHGLFGEVANLVLTATSGSFNDLDGDLEPDDEYSLAQYYGQHHGSCHEIYPSCPVSITGFLSMVVPTFFA